MSRILTKNKATYSLIASVIESIVLGIYLSMISDKFIKGNNVWTAISLLEWYNLLAVVFIALFVFQIYLSLLEKKSGNDEKKQLIDNMLQAACSSIIYPNNALHIRSIITVCDYKNWKRTTVYAYNIESDPERTATYDLTFGVTGEAVKQKVPVARALPPNHIETYSPENAQFVEKDLRCVLAAPIFSKNKKGEVVAVLAFDSFEPIENIQFNTRKSRELAQMWADIFSRIL